MIIPQQILTYRLEFEPVAQPRARACNMGGFIKMYDPSSKEKEKAKKLLSPSKRTEMAQDDELEVSLVFACPIPVSLSNRLKNARNWHRRKTTKPDIDNYIKFILDVCNSILWVDDAQIHTISAKKIFSEKPFTEITLLVKKPIDFTTKEFHIMTLISPDELKDLISSLQENVNMYHFCEKMAEENPECQSYQNAHYLRSLSASFQKYLPVINKLAKANASTFKNGKTLS